MPAQFIDGKSLAETLRQQVGDRAKRFLSQHGRAPGLTVILVGNNPASEVYVRHKVAACEKASIVSELIRLDASCSTEALLQTIQSLNANPNVDGILVQLPLPGHIPEKTIIEAISPNKDVDGFHPVNAGALFTGQPCLKPCTPLGVMVMLDHQKTPLRAAEAVVVGASNIVGKPLAMMLLQAGATVTICNSKTQNLEEKTRRADILIAAVGRPGLITAEMVKPGAVVIDVGINRLASGKLVGDVDFENVARVAKAITPVPGGVGPMTIAMLLQNTLDAAESVAH
ncbi:MAG: bifunctional methylenetetrahydrofolate dehydrogenase/methenyltetrahydrofolate cyclohydrolase FolD, partial [Burkholderiaceae bacterium]